MGKRELVILLFFLVSRDVWFLLAVPQVCLQFVIEAFPDHTPHFLLAPFLYQIKQGKRDTVCIILYFLYIYAKLKKKLMQQHSSNMISIL